MEINLKARRKKFLTIASYLHCRLSENASGVSLGRNRYFSLPRTLEGKKGRVIAAIFQPRLSADQLEVHVDSLSRLVAVHVLSLTARPPRKRSRTRSAIVISAKAGLSISRVNVCAISRASSPLTTCRKLKIEKGEEGRQDRYISRGWSRNMNRARLDDRIRLKNRSIHIFRGRSSREDKQKRKFSRSHNTTQPRHV